MASPCCGGTASRTSSRPPRRSTGAPPPRRCSRTSAASSTTRARPSGCASSIRSWSRDGCAGSPDRLVGLPVPLVLRRGNAAAPAARGVRRPGGARVAELPPAPAPGPGTDARAVPHVHAELGPAGPRSRLGETRPVPPSQSMPPALVAKAAATFGADAFERVHARLLQAYFGENRDITDAGTLLALWDEVGLPVAEFGRAGDRA